METAIKVIQKQGKRNAVTMTPSTQRTKSYKISADPQNSKKPIREADPPRKF